MSQQLRRNQPSTVKNKVLITHQDPDHLVAGSCLWEVGA